MVALLLRANRILTTTIAALAACGYAGVLVSGLGRGGVLRANALGSGLYILRRR